MPIKLASLLILPTRPGACGFASRAWSHYYTLNKIGTDTIFHSAEYPSALTLPVTEGA
jgi:hypothetical protein